MVDPGELSAATIYPGVLAWDRSYTLEAWSVRSDHGPGWGTLADILADIDNASAKATTTFTTTSLRLDQPPDASTVFAFETLIATTAGSYAIDEIDFYVDEQLIDTDTDGGDGWSGGWDTTQVTDGAHTVHAVATDTDSIEHVSATHHVAVDNAAGQLARVGVDYERGLLDGDEWSVLAVLAHTSPLALPDRYDSGASPSLPEVDSSSLAWVLGAAGDLASTSTLEALEAHLSGMVGVEVELEDQVPQAARAEWEACEEANTTNSAQVDIPVILPPLPPGFLDIEISAGKEWCTYRDDIFEIRFRVDPEDHAAGFDDAGVPGGGSDPVAPDRVLDVMGELKAARDSYEALGFELDGYSSSDRLVVYMHGDTNMALPFGPGGGGRPMIWVQADSPRPPPDTSPQPTADFQIRHELFHVFQYGYMGALPLQSLGHVSALLGNPFTPLWMEATAEWAAGRASEGRPDMQEGEHVRNLAHLLGSPESALFSFRGAQGILDSTLTVGEVPPRRVYGAFILPEFLESVSIGSVLETWRNIDTSTDALEAIEDELDEQSIELSGFVRGFWVASYLLTHGNDETTIPSFSSLLDVDAWRGALGAEGTGGDSFSSLDRADRAAPTVTVPLSGETDPVEVLVGPGGAAIVDLQLPTGFKGDLNFEVAVDDPEDVLVSVLAYDADPGYPIVCERDDFPVAFWQASLATADITGEVELAEDCHSATLFVTHHDLRGIPQPVSARFWLEDPAPMMPPDVDTTIAVGSGESANLALGDSAGVVSDQGIVTYNVCIDVKVWRTFQLFPDQVDIYLEDPWTGQMIDSRTGIETLFTSSPTTFTFGPYLQSPWRALSVRVEEVTPYVTHWTATPYSVGLYDTTC